MAKHGKKKRPNDKHRRLQVAKMPTQKRVESNMSLMIQSLSEYTSYVWYRGSVAFLLFLSWLANSCSIDALPVGDKLEKLENLVLEIKFDTKEDDRNGANGQWRFLVVKALVQEFHEQHPHDLLHQIQALRLPQSLQRKNLPTKPEKKPLGQKFPE